ncbi:hypothetical protein RY27_02805, partial [Litorilinea aerophila]
MKSTKPLSRRTFLKGSALLSAGMALAACGPSAAPQAPAAEGGAQAPAPPPATTPDLPFEVAPESVNP